MDANTLARAMGNRLPQSRYDALCEPFNAALLQADCTTVDRVAMFCAQIGHESDGLYYTEEIASGSDYEWRKDLGNAFAGDGVRYKGRSFIQVTGRANYSSLSKWAHSKGFVPSPTFFVEDPASLASDKHSMLGAVWYWTVERNMNSFADRADIEGATRAVNGGLNGYSDRINRWNTCRPLGAALLPEEGFLMGLDNGKQDTVWSGAAQVNGPSSKVRRAARWLIKFLPPSFDWTKNPDGPWVRDEIDAIVNEVVTGVFTFAPTDTIDFEDGKGPVKLVDVDPSTPVNFVTLLRIIAAKQVGGK